MIAKRPAAIASSTVAGKRCLNSVVTGWREVELVPNFSVAICCDVLPVLDVDRLVEPVLVLDRRDRLGGRPLTEEGGRGAAGKRSDPEEDEDREPE